MNELHFPFAKNILLALFFVFSMPGAAPDKPFRKIETSSSASFIIKLSLFSPLAGENNLAARDVASKMYRLMLTEISAVAFHV